MPAAGGAIDGELLAAADRRIRQSPGLSSTESLVVVHRGEVVSEADAYSEPRRFGRLLRGLIESYVVAATRRAA